MFIMNAPAYSLFNQESIVILEEYPYGIVSFDRLEVRKRTSRQKYNFCLRITVYNNCSLLPENESYRFYSSYGDLMDDFKKHFKRYLSQLLPCDQQKYKQYV